MGHYRDRGAITHKICVDELQCIWPLKKILSTPYILYCVCKTEIIEIFISAK